MKSIRFLMVLLYVRPVLSHITRVGKTDPSAELKWLPGLGTKHRLKGDHVWFKFALLF